MRQLFAAMVISDSPSSPHPVDLDSGCGATLGLLLRQTRDLSRDAMQRELAASGHDLTFSQYITLRKLDAGIANVTELARAAELNPGAMTRLLDKLEEKGLVERKANPGDRRALRIVPTEAARRLFPDMQACADRVRARALTGMTDPQAAQLTRLLEQVRDNLQQLLAEEGCSPSALSTPES